MQPQTLSHLDMISNEDGPRKNADHEAGDTYGLPPHVFVCQTQDCVVFLDAERDRYVGIGGPEADALRSMLLAKCSARTVRLSSQLEQELDRLVARGLLTRDPTSARRLRPVEIQLGSCAIGPGAQYEHALRFTHVIAALVACISARFDLRFRGIGSTVARLVAEKQKVGRQAFTEDPDELRRLVGIFRVIRPFLYARKDKCLFHGLALYRFLRHYGFSPTWVIGVGTAPFSAHCWVQYGDCVLDDSPEQTLEFTPLAAI